MDEEKETVPPIEEVVSQVQEAVEQEAPTEKEETQVPLSALQKERRKRQEIEMELKWVKENSQKPLQPQEDNSAYESATKADLSRSEFDIVRKVEERSWIKNNPEKYERVNELLPEFLKRRPNLASAINEATNRYEEAWELMDKLSPKEQKQMAKPSPVKKEAPGSPSSVSKAASMNQAVDVMTMSDAEFNAWRRSQKRAR